MTRYFKHAYRPVVLSITFPSLFKRAEKVKCVLRSSLALLALTLTNGYASEPLECLIEPHVVVDVSSSEIGVLSSVPVEKAATVRKGDVIAALHTDVEKAALVVSRTRAGSKSEIQLLRYDYHFNIRKGKRLKELQQKQMVSAQDLDEVQAAQEVARLRMQAASEKQQRSELEAVRDELALARRIVRSPIDGVVVERYKAAGEFVDGDPILQLAQLDPLRIEMVVPIAMYGQIKVGMEATVLPEMPINGPFVAIVTHIDPIMDAATATFGVRLSLPNPEHRLPPGLRCNLILLPYEEASVDNAVVEKKVAATTPAEPNSPRLDVKPVLGAATECDPQDTASVDSVCGKSNLLAGTVVTPAVAADNAQCSTLGPIIDVATENQLTNLLTTNDLKFLQRYDTTVVTGSPWTVLSRQQHPRPQELINRAKLAGINDIQWLKRGPKKHRFPFGRFRDELNAKNRAEQMRKLGFETDIEPSIRKESALWLDLSSTPNNSALSAINSILSESDNELAIQPISCPQVASR